ncbi:MAG: PEP-CTERM sorting domain-containing protein [Bryobacteraceae bacterium]
MKLISLLLLAGAMVYATPMPTAKVTLANAGNPTNLIVGNIYIGPYTLTINGQNYAAMCIDYNDESWIGASWNAYLTPVAGGDFADTYQAANKNVAQEYGEEAYLFSQITQPGIANQQRTDIQEAGWSITDPSYTPDAGAQTWLQLAEADYSSMNLNGYEIVSSVNTPHQQEFMIATPEPASWSLLGLGLLACAAFALYRRKRAAQ